MVAGHRIDDGAVNDLLGRVVLVIAHNADFDRRLLERRLPQNIGRAAVSISIGRPRVSARLHLNSSPIPSDSFTTGIALQAIVGPPSMRWRNPSPAQGGWHCRFSCNKRNCRHGDYGRGTPPFEWPPADQNPPRGLRRPPDRRRPVYRIHVSDRLLEIHDGPFLELGLKGIAGTLIDRPRRLEDRPDRDRLAIRFEQFKKAA
jgi:hypothetical protein